MTSPASFYCKSNRCNDLALDYSENVYAMAVSDAEFWRAVGGELRRRRLLYGATSTWTFHQKHRGVPVTNTLDAIEEGRPGRVDNIERYCRALGTTTADVFRAVLDAADGLGPTLSDAEWQLVQTVRDMPDSPGKTAWLLLGETMRERHEDRDPDD